MKAGPDIARIGALLGDPARTHMLSALMSGEALTAGELAREAGITAQTASSHLARLADGGLIVSRKQGRCVYFRLAGARSPAAGGPGGARGGAGHMRVRTGPRDAAMRRARVCYDHLAGELGVADARRPGRRGWSEERGGAELTDDGSASWQARCRSMAIRFPSAPSGVQGLPRLERAAQSPRRLARCRHHDALCGTEMGGADPAPGSRVVNFSRNGEKRFAALFGTARLQHDRY